MKPLRWLPLVLSVVVVALYLLTLIPTPSASTGTPSGNAGLKTDTLNPPSVSGHVITACAAVTTCLSPSINMASQKGDTLVLIVDQNGTTAPSAVKDAHGSTALSLRKTKLEINAQQEYYTGPNTGAEANVQVYVNFSGSTTYSFSVIVVTATTQASSIDATCTGTNGISTSASDTVTTVTAGDLVIAGIVAGGAEVVTPTGGATALNTSSQATVSGYAQWQIDASTGSLTVTATLGTKHYWAECAMAFKPGTVPSAPTGISVTLQTNNSLTWSWTAPPGVVANNTLYWGAASCASFPNTVSTGGAGAGATTPTTLSSATQYCGKAEAWNTTGNSAFSSTATGWTLPSKPTSLTVPSKTYYSLNLTWTNPSGTLTDNHVYWQAGSTCPSPNSIDLGGVQTSYDLFGLAGNTQYCVQVTATSAGGESINSVKVTPTTLADPVPGSPSALTNGAVTTATHAITWTNPGGGGLLNNTVLWRTGTTCSAYTSSASTGSAVTSYTITGLAANTTYCWTTGVWNISGESALPAGLVFHTVGVPWSPTALTNGAVTTTSLAVTWTNHNTSLVNDTVFWGTTCGTYTSAHSLAGVATSYTITGLATNTSYCWTVTSWNATGQSGVPAGVKFRTIGVPWAPTGLTNGVITSTSIAVSWTNHNTSLVNDTVFWGAVCGTYTSAHSLAGSGTSYTITGLTTNQTYCWTVTSWNATGQSPTPTGVVFHIIGVPWAPTGLTNGVITATSIAVTWTNRNTTLVNDTVFWGSVCGTYTSAHSLAGVGTSYTISGLAANTTLCWTVTSWNSTGQSPTPAGKVFHTIGVPWAPTSLVLTSTTLSSVKLTWSNRNTTLLNNTILYGTGSGCSSFPTQVSTTSAVATFTVTGLASGATFCFEVESWNATGASPVSNHVTATTGSLPGPVTNLTVFSVTVSSATLTWTIPSHSSLVNATIVYGLKCLGTNFGLSAGGGVSGYTVSGLISGTTFCFGVEVWNTSGASPLRFVNGTTGGNNAGGGGKNNGGGGGGNALQDNASINATPSLFPPVTLPILLAITGIGFIGVGVVVAVAGKSRTAGGVIGIIGLAILAVAAFLPPWITSI